MSNSNAIRNEEMADLAHDIRTPLGIALACSELLLIEDTLNDEAREHVTLILKNIRLLEKKLSKLNNFFQEERAE